MTEPTNEMERPASSAGGTGPEGVNWEKQVLEKLVLSTLDEQRRTRRWGIFFKFLLAGYLLLLLVLYWPGGLEAPTGGDGHTALVNIEGVISSKEKASADNIVTGLRDAFEDEKTKGVILRINSPGGSPVQSGYVYDEIRRLREKHPEIPLYAVISDLCASGGYYIASAADKIYADKASMVGSIGVLMNGFGFVDALEKLGIERRLLTAGEHKAFLDPFSPTKEEEVAYVKGLLEGIHRQFIDAVKQGRGDRLTDDAKIFSGLIWSGEEGVRIGLVDELASASKVAREVIGVEEIVDFTAKPNFLDQLAGRVGASVGEVIASKLGLGATGIR